MSAVGCAAEVCECSLSDLAQRVSRRIVLDFRACLDIEESGRGDDVEHVLCKIALKARQQVCHGGHPCEVRKIPPAGVGLDVLKHKGSEDHVESSRCNIRPVITEQIDGVGC